MKRKLLNMVITLLAVVGVIVFIGAVGSVDYAVTVGKEFPLIDMIKMVLVAIVMIIPSVVREVI